MASALMGGSILVVDDDEAARIGLRILLGAEGEIGLAAAGGQAALDQLRASRRRLIVLLDWLLPDLDGTRVIQTAVKSACRAGGTLQPAAHTFLLMTATRKGASDLPPGVSVDILYKPFSIADLPPRIKVAAAEAVEAL